MPKVNIPNPCHTVTFFVPFTFSLCLLQAWPQVSTPPMSHHPLPKPCAARSHRIVMQHVIRPGALTCHFWVFLSSWRDANPLGPFLPLRSQRAKFLPTRPETVSGMETKARFLQTSFARAETPSLAVQLDSRERKQKPVLAGSARHTEKDFS